MIYGSALGSPAESVQIPALVRQAKVSGVARLYGPAARCKPKVMIWRRLVLRFCIRPIDGAFEAPGHHGYPRAFDLIRVSAPKARWAT